MGGKLIPNHPSLQFAFCFVYYTVRERGKWHVSAFLRSVLCLQSLCIVEVRRSVFQQLLMEIQGQLLWVLKGPLSISAGYSESYLLCLSSSCLHGDKLEDGPSHGLTLAQMFRDIFITDFPLHVCYKCKRLQLHLGTGPSYKKRETFILSTIYMCM